MTARCVVAGTIAPRSQPRAMRVRGVTVEPTRTPIVAQLTPLGCDVAVLCDAILRGDVEPCACGRFACDCDEWAELMNTDPTDPDPHGDLRALQAMEIPV